MDDWTHPGTGAVTDPEAVAEGVTLCGRCIANEHHLAPAGFLPALLEAIARRDDDVLERAIDAVRA
jgi:hypothetical protein